MIMKTMKLAACAAALTVGFGLAASSQANAQAAVMKECGDGAAGFDTVGRDRLKPLEGA